MSASTFSATPRLIRAARKETLDRPPVWLMRQAGRYLPEYMAIREKVSFLELCKSPDLAVEVSLQPYERFGMDGVILFSDILIPAEAMGLPLEFTEKGPWFPAPLRSPEQIEKLITPDPVERTGFVADIVKQLRQALSSTPETALIGFAGSPWTLATYMVEGGVSRNFTHIKTLMYNDPILLHQLLEKIADTVTLYLNMQIEAGAQVVQLFDTWGAIVPPQLYREFVHRYQKRVIEGLRRDLAPVILYVNNGNQHLELMAETGADVVSLDWLTPLHQAKMRLGDTVALQGNLDPNALFAKPEVVQSLAESMLLEGGSQGYIFNLGHGILPQTPVETVKLLVDTVKSTSFSAFIEPSLVTPLGRE